MSKKRIILFAPPLFYGYWKHIKREFENLGFEVDFITYRTNKLFESIINSMSETIKSRNYDRIVENRIRNLKGKYDVLIVVKGLYFSQTNFDLIKNLNPGIKSIMYQWDSVKNHNYLDFAKRFDKVFTFDPEDTVYNGFEYLPLFYTNDIIEAQNRFDGKEDIDLLLIGIYNKSRYEFLKRLQRLSPKLNIYTHLVVPPGLYIRQELFTHKLGLKKKEDYQFSPITREKLLGLYCRSKVFVDVCQNQSGMSMRTIEAYGMNKKLLTSNDYIIKEEDNLREMLTLNLNASDNEIIDFTNSPISTYKNKDKFNLNLWCQRILS